MNGTMTYDTAEIRGAARKIQNCAQNVRNDAQPRLSGVRREVEASFRGEAAEALGERLDDIEADVQAIYSGLSALCRTLFRFADALDEADRRIADML